MAPDRTMQAEFQITRWDGGQAAPASDAVAVEEPLQILVNGENLTMTMRTPGHDFELAAGLLYAERIIRSGEDVLSIAYCSDPASLEDSNTVNVFLNPGWQDAGDAARWQRRFISTASCGLCGKTSIDAARALTPPLDLPDFVLPAPLFSGLGEQMRAAQRVFARTGGLHAAALYDRAGKLLSLREDVGRHNALDKLIGAEVLAERTPLTSRILMVSGRTSFEIIQKAAAASIPVICAVSAPSSLAVELARNMNITLVGFLRGEKMNVYAGAGRIG